MPLAVLTENIWEFARPKMVGERIVQNQIVVVSTWDSRAKIQDLLLGSKHGNLLRPMQRTSNKLQSL